jgi:hypothetical protein
MTFAIGIVVVAIVIAGIVYSQRGGHVELPGKILKVRTAPIEEKRSAAVIDFRVTNPSDHPFQVRSVTVVLEDASGARTEGYTASEIDAQHLMAGVPLLGVPKRTTLDRMIAASFELPEAQLEARKRFLVRVEEVDGVVQELTEK